MATSIRRKDAPVASAAALAAVAAPPTNPMTNAGSRPPQTTPAARAYRDAKQPPPPSTAAVGIENGNNTLNGVLRCIATEAIIEYASRLNDFTQSYEAYTQKKIKNLNRVEHTETDEKTEEEELSALVESMKLSETQIKQHPHTYHQIEISPTETVGIPVPTEPTQPTKEKEAAFAADKRAAFSMLSAKKKMSEILEIQDERKSTVRIVNVNRHGKARYFKFFKKEEAVIRGDIALHADCRALIFHLKGASSSFVYNGTRKEIPSKFHFLDACDEDLPAEPWIPIDLKDRQRRTYEAEYISELGCSIAHKLAFAVMVKAGFASLKSEETYKLRADLIGIGAALVDWTGPDESPITVLNNLLDMFKDAWEVASRIRPVRLRCPACRHAKPNAPQCEKCHDKVILDNRVYRSQADHTLRHRLQAIENLTQLLLQGMPSLQTTHRVYWDFFIDLWAPQLIAYGNTESFFFGGRHRWSYDKVRNFLSPKANCTGSVFRAALLSRVPIQIVHFDAIEDATDKNVKAYFAAERNNLMAVFEREYKKQRSDYLNALMPTGSPFAQPIRKSGGGPVVIAELIFSYLILQPNERFCKFRVLLDEAQRDSSILHCVRVSDAYKFDQKFNFNAPDILARKKMMNDVVVQRQRRFLIERGFTVSESKDPTILAKLKEESKAYGDELLRVPLQIQPVDPNDTIFIRKEFAVHLGIADEAKETVQMAAVDVATRPKKRYTAKPKSKK